MVPWGSQEVSGRSAKRGKGEGEGGIEFIKARDEMSYLEPWLVRTSRYVFPNSPAFQILRKAVLR